MLWGPACRKGIMSLAVRGGRWRAGDKTIFGLKRTIHGDEERGSICFKVHQGGDRKPANLLGLLSIRPEKPV